MEKFVSLGLSSVLAKQTYHEQRVRKKYDVFNRIGNICE